jgi:ATP/maltotriose-dependent transcriptional regulator MalT
MLSSELTQRLIHRFASAPAPQPHDSVPESLAVLTTRELEVLRLVACGLSYREGDVTSSGSTTAASCRNCTLIPLPGVVR